ncbi:hypothetical protein KHA88_08025 [Bacillus sp. FJAT-49754]|uniref:Phage protein n=2 Tax=Lederbergia citrea TaxID=2833581 RepID=A0A942UNY2_9BACI|nr:hypothetical protein [Lederbergia citrea]MBS4221389.1 hypothetical protein [Lederbergia citrea]
MNLPLKEQLKVWKKDHAEFKQRKKPKKRRSDVLTESDIRSLMGMDRAVYVRGKGGRTGKNINRRDKHWIFLN